MAHNKTAVKDNLVFGRFSTVTVKNNSVSAIFVKCSVLLQSVAFLYKTQTMHVNTQADKSERPSASWKTGH